MRRESLQLTHVPIVETGMLIRKPVADVFEAIVNPAITTRFWYEHGIRLNLVADRYPAGIAEHD
jgi:uncharacterized protein YndB with AHSA1/START domain